MNVQELQAKIEAEVQNQLVAYRLDTTWKYEIVSKKKNAEFGSCNYLTKTIKLNIVMCAINPWSIVLDTILHEIAHALAYENYNETGHGKYWKTACNQIGANPKAMGPTYFLPYKSTKKYVEWKQLGANNFFVVTKDEAREVEARYEEIYADEDPTKVDTGGVGLYLANFETLKDFISYCMDRNVAKEVIVNVLIDAGKNPVTAKNTVSWYISNLKKAG